MATKVKKHRKKAIRNPLKSSQHWLKVADRTPGEHKRTFSRIQKKKHEISIIK